MYSGLLFILIPLAAGYAIRLRQRFLLRLTNRLLSAMVWLILFFMGVNLAFIDNLHQNLLIIFRLTIVCATCILACNWLALRLLEHRLRWPRHPHRSAVSPRWPMLLSSLILCGVVLAGFLTGLSNWPPLRFAAPISNYLLILLLFLAGLQLRSSGISLHQILLNHRGIIIALVVCLSALAGGILAALVLGLSLKTGLALASGYGWYSLSGILIADAFGPVIGSAAFFNDLLRELLSIALVPLLSCRSRTLALGLCGATSMDFTLPVLQRAAGVDIVPAAIVHGFILSILAPVLIAFFSS